MLFFVEIPVFLNYFQKRCNKTSFFGFYITEESKFGIAYTSEAGETVVSKTFIGIAWENLLDRKSVV